MIAGTAVVNPWHYRALPGYFDANAATRGVGH